MLPVVSIYHAHAAKIREEIRCEKEFIRILNDFFLEQINTFPTRENNIFDLVLTNIPEKIDITEILKPTDAGIFTDHSVLMFDLTTSCKPLPRVIRYIRLQLCGS